MKNNLLSLPAGFRDLIFDEVKQRRDIETKLAALFEQRGYREVRPSGIEYLEVYTRGKQSIKERVFKFLDRDDNLLGLRADFTPAIARIVAARLSTSEPPIKVWYCGNVFRKGGLHGGRFHEFGQIGAELLGVNSLQRDIEAIDLVMQCLAALGIADVRVHVNHAGVFRGIVTSLGLDRAGQRALKSEIDRKDARGLAARLKSLGVKEEIQVQVNALAGLVGERDVLKRAAEVLTNPESCRAVQDLERLADGLRRWEANLTFDLAEIDEMEYYTGIMFTIFSPKLQSELGQGGRYDTLLQEFGAAMPAIGFSFSMDGLAEIA